MVLGARTCFCHLEFHNCITQQFSFKGHQSGVSNREYGCNAVGISTWRADHFWFWEQGFTQGLLCGYT